VLTSLYLLFNEGYKASSGEKLVREANCSEAIRLTGLLAEQRRWHQPKTQALLALMLMNAARIPARVDDEGNLLRLQEQDRFALGPENDCARDVSFRAIGGGQRTHRISFAVGHRGVSLHGERL